MAETEKFGSIRRFGARYGTKVKHRFGEIEKQQRKKHKCPYCSAQKVKRIAVGIWYCSKCKTKFSGKAYSIGKNVFKEESKKEVKEGENKNG